MKNSTVIHPFKGAVSMAAQTNPGMKLANPIARMPLKFGEDGAPRAGTAYFVGDTKHPDPDAPGRFTFDPLEFEGAPFSADNVHLLRPGSEISGIVDLSTVCASNMGISVPTSVQLLYVKSAAPTQLSMTYLFFADP